MTTTPTLFLASQQANSTDVGSPGDDQTQIKLIEFANGKLLALWLSNTDGGRISVRLGMTSLVSITMQGAAKSIGIPRKWSCF